MPILSTDVILAQTTMTEQTVPVPEWGEGGEVVIRALTKGKSQALRAASMDKAWEGGKQVETFNQDKFELALFVAGVVEPAFAPDQAAQLSALSSGPVDRVIKAIMTLSGLTTDGKTSGEAVDKAQKEFPPQS